MHAQQLCIRAERMRSHDNAARVKEAGQRAVEQQHG